ncbi:sulfatase-like hydrolase/transferase [Reichenbachiella sp. MSK19-1]|uniref:sulfatase-like hydrolase/transferase n=1 Tax=Reichenbachiella sp. MSK19-1 TaxID=1897631 RepID=UPI000E6C0597|nr:sulfatase-like hydrolase/transferase [Reichenbachiella sp. MSK19-1]RJE72528.1 sulfatase [Reichenbachiella sp. MSK19-1]
MQKSLVVFLIAFTSVVSSFAQPNILFIESDDQSNQAVGAFGHPEMKTPNIDRIADAGVSFTSAYNMGCWSPAVCVPSRTMLFYGKYLWDSQKITKDNAPKAMPELLKEAGYSTYMTGKWHAWGKPVAQLFDSLGSIQPGQLKTYNSPEGHITDVTGREAVSFIENYQDDAPYFLYVAFNAPHVPRQTEQKYYDMYPTDEIGLPPSVVEGPLNPNIEYNYTNAPLSKKTMRNRVQQNSAMVTHMDDRIGDILDALKASGEYENTIIVFMSDHGISFGENGVAGKVCLYEPSVTAPLIIKAPGMTPGKQHAERVYLQDIYPTLLSILGIDQPDAVAFQSLIPLVEHKQKPRKSIYLAMFDSQRGIISEDRKMIIYPESGDCELYDLENDPWETTNLIGSDKYRKTEMKLLKELRKWQNEVGDTLSIRDFR